MNFNCDHAVMQGAFLMTKDCVGYQGFNSSPKEELIVCRERAWLGNDLNIALMGIDVVDLTRKCGLKYNNGPRTVTLIGLLVYNDHKVLTD